MHAMMRDLLSGTSLVVRNLLTQFFVVQSNLILSQHLLMQMHRFKHKQLINSLQMCTSVAKYLMMMGALFTFMKCQHL